MSNKPKNITPTCIECGSVAQLVTGKEIYPHRSDLHAKPFYRCACGAYCGTHPNTTIALGYPCGPATRKARSSAHTAFDALWKTGLISRKEAYSWLSRTLSLPRDDTHIAMMDRGQAMQVARLASEHMRALQAP